MCAEVEAAKDAVCGSRPGRSPHRSGQDSTPADCAVYGAGRGDEEGWWWCEGTLLVQARASSSGVAALPFRGRLDFTLARSTHQRARARNIDSPCGKHTPRERGPKRPARPASGSGKYKRAPSSPLRQRLQLTSGGGAKRPRQRDAQALASRATARRSFDPARTHTNTARGS
jgi:hypothetical protein